MKRINCILTAAMFTVTVHAQTTVVTGTFRDSVDNETEPYATLRVYKAEERKTPFAMSVTDVDGNFRQTVKGRGKFVLVFSSLGKKTVERTITLSGEPTYNMGIVNTAPDDNTLKGVEVVAQKPIVKMETDKMTYNVEQDVEAQSSTVLDMLRKVPMVVVDGQDNITVNGSSSFKILVDGKPNPMFQNNASQIFKSMPASMVKNIEVITSPGAKYDAEGTGGVLNILLNHQEGSNQQLNGYNGNISATVGNRAWNTSAMISGQQGKFSYSANAFYNDMTMDGTKVNINRQQPNTNLEYNEETDMSVPFAMGNISMGYQTDSMSSINFNAGLTQFRLKQDGYGHTAYSTFAYDGTRKLRNNNFGFNGSLDYQRFLNSSRTSNITLSYLLNVNPSHTEQTNLYDADSLNGWYSLSDRYNDSRTHSTTHSAQADLTLQLSKVFSLESGLKYVFRHISSDAKYYDLQDDEQILNDANSSNYSNNQQIAAAYAQLSGQFGKLSAKAGLRYEYTWESVDYKKGNGDDFDKNYGNLVPSATISYSYSPAFNIGMNYSMRISRPGITYLNPWVNRSSNTQISYGNPDLDVEKTHTINLVANMFTPKFMTSITLGQSFCNNQIAQYSFMGDDYLLNTTYDNIVKTRWTNLNIFARWTPWKTTTLMLNGGLSYGDMHSDRLDMSNHGWQANAYIGIEQQLPWNTTLSLGTYLKNRSYSVQGYNGGMHFLNASITKKLLHDRLSISLRYFSPYGSKIHINNYSRGSNYAQNTKITVPSQYINLTLSWNFGNTKKSFTQHQTKISNDFKEQESRSEQLNMMGQSNM